MSSSQSKMAALTQQAVGAAGGAGAPGGAGGGPGALAGPGGKAVNSFKKAVTIKVGFGLTNNYYYYYYNSIATSDAHSDRGW